jgi:predicted ester cyclase
MKQKQFILAITIIILSAGSKSWSQQSGGQAVNNQKTNKKMETSTTEKNKATVRNIFEQAFNGKKTELLKDLIDDAYEGPRGGKGYEGFLGPVQSLLAAFPDIEWTIVELIGEGDIVMLHFKWKGTHKGQFTKYPATGKTVISEGMGVYHFKNGKVISSTVSTDRLGFWQQIGVLPLDI